VVDALQHDGQQKVGAAKFHGVHEPDQAPHRKGQIFVEAELDKGLCDLQLDDHKDHQRQHRGDEQREDHLRAPASRRRVS
jgi:hypothetical protein